MTGQIEIIRRKVWEDNDGNRVSAYGAPPIGSEWHLIERGWTWRVTDHRGNVTVGLGRHPATSYTEALNVAHKAAQRLKMEVI